MIIFALCIILPSLTLITSEPLSLTDKTWKDMLCGQWMVQFYAPWCPSCQNFKPIWNELEKVMAPREVKVASVDINEYPSLSGRFGISVLPTIYYVRDGVFRQFNGVRSLEGLKDYIDHQEWQRTAPVSSYFAPDSILMSIVGSIFDVSLLVKNAYTVLQDQYGWPAWLIYIVLALAIIFIGLILGFGVLMIIDYCLAGSSKDETSFLPEDSRDVEELDENDDQPSIETRQFVSTKKSVPSYQTSSTPQRSTKASTRRSPGVRIQNDEQFLFDVLHGDQDDENASEGSDHSEVVAAMDEDANRTKKTVRRRRHQGN